MTALLGRGSLKLRWSHLSSLRKVALSAEEVITTLTLSHFRRRDLRIADENMPLPRKQPNSLPSLSPVWSSSHHLGDSHTHTLTHTHTCTHTHTQCVYSNETHTRTAPVLLLRQQCSDFQRGQSLKTMQGAKMTTNESEYKTWFSICLLAPIIFATS